MRREGSRAWRSKANEVLQVLWASQRKMPFKLLQMSVWVRPQYLIHAGTAGFARWRMSERIPWMRKLRHRCVKQRESKQRAQLHNEPKENRIGQKPNNWVNDRAKQTFKETASREWHRANRTWSWAPPSLESIRWPDGRGTEACPPEQHRLRVAVPGLWGYATT